MTHLALLLTVGWGFQEAENAMEAPLTDEDIGEAVQDMWNDASEINNVIPPAANAGQTAPSASTKPTALTKTDAPRCSDGTAPETAEQSIGPHALKTEACTHFERLQLVSASVDGFDWRWTPAKNELNHTFEWIGHDPDGHGYMVLRNWACAYDGCKRATFFQFEAGRDIKQLGQATQAEVWSIHSSGRLVYTANVGYNEGYSIASASQTFEWTGSEFSATGAPGFQIQYPTWPCEDSAVSVVDQNTATPTGETVPIKQGDAIEVLQVGANQPLGSLFQYRVNGVEFWASNWEQTCAG